MVGFYSLPLCLRVKVFPCHCIDVVVCALLSCGPGGSTLKRGRVVTQLPLLSCVFNACDSTIVFITVVLFNGACVCEVILGM